METAPSKIARASLLDTSALKARLSGRSLWAMLYGDGTVIHESERDWLDLPPTGRRSIRLYAPNGQQVTLDDGRDATGRVFQLKVAVAGAGGERSTWAHLIGLVTHPDGTALCAVWDYRTRTLHQFSDNAAMMCFENIGPLCSDHLGLARP